MITINIRYYGKDDNARRFAEEMTATGIVDEIRREEGNLRYEYYYPADSDDHVLLIDSWQDQAALDRHHALPVMQKIMELRDKYDLHMIVEKYQPIAHSDEDKKYIK